MPTLALDWGGVLVTDGSISAWAALERALGIRAEEGAMVWSQLQRPADLGEIGEDQVWRELARLKPGSSPQDIRQVFLDEYREIPFGIEAMRSASDAGWQVALATNNVSSWLCYWRERFDWFDLIDVICCSSELGVRKPSASFFQRLLAVVEDPRPYFVDDKQANVAAAKAAGLHAVQTALDQTWPLPTFAN